MEKTRNMYQKDANFVIDQVTSIWLWKADRATPKMFLPY